MPSFTRRVPSAQTKPPPVGTIPSLSASTPPLHLLPTGIPSLDDLLGGGLPLGNSLAITAPDAHTAWARLAARYFIAQGLVVGQKSVLVGQEDECRDLVSGCMWVDERGHGAGAGEGSESEGEGVGGGVGEGKGGVRIAWRYERMKRFQTTVKGTGPELNLMTPLPHDLLAHLEASGVQSYVPLKVPSAGGSKTSEGWSILCEALRGIAQVLAGHDDSQALRLTIHDLGSADWGSPNEAEIHRFLHCLRGLTRNKSVGVMITFPARVSRAGPEGCTDVAAWTARLGWDVDALIELKGFGDDPTLPPLFHPLHGLISLPTLPSTHHLLPPSFKHSSLLGLAGTSGSGGAGENNLGFRLKRKRFVVETVHLGIEGGTGERRTEPKAELGSLVAATTATVGGERGVSEGVEKVQGQMEAVQLGDKVEEGNSGVGLGSGNGSVGKPKGADGDRPKKPRARVRFGGEEEMGVEVEVSGGKDEQAQVGHDHDHGHTHPHPHSHDQARPQSHGQAPTRPVVRHDRPDLYEF